MYIREHYPAHFHAEYGEYEITVDIETGVVTGKFPEERLMWSLSGMCYIKTNSWPTGRQR